MKKLILSTLALCFLMTIQAQDEDFVIKEQNPTLAIAIVPQSFAYNIAELNLDVRVADRQWLTIAPLFQYGTNNKYIYEPVDAIQNGIGLGLNYRYFPLTRHTRFFSDGKGPFVSAGIRGISTVYKYAGNSLINYTDNYGIAGTVPDPNTVFTDRVSQVGLNVNIGYVLRMFDILFVETYMGVGTRYSNYVYDSFRGLNLGDNSYDAGFSGYCFTGGFRFGIFLNRYTRK